VETLTSYSTLAHASFRQIIVYNRLGSATFLTLLPNYRIWTGPIVLILTLYQFYGFLLAFFIKQVFWVPHRFRHGIYVAAGWGNYGELRT
jgi:predicted permease